MRHIAFSRVWCHDEGHDRSRPRPFAPSRWTAYARAAQLELRASDADRDRAAAAFGSALAVGRLTTTEYAKRLDAVNAATILGELVPLTRDLPTDNVTDASAGAAGRAEVAAPAGTVRGVCVVAPDTLCGGRLARSSASSENVGAKRRGLASK